MGVVVLGMHRSGTSAAARAINLLGVPFGEGRLVPTTAFNPLGHWESWELQDINNDLLASFGGNWAGPPVLGPGWVEDPRATALGSQAAAAWSMVHRQDPWLWKDPRTSLTLPFWRRVVAPRAVAVIMHRHPVEVAWSLAERDEFSLPVSVALWERYTRDALIGAAGWPVMIVGYDDLVRDPVGWTFRVREFLVGHGVILAADGRPPEEAAGAVVPDLRHGHAVADDGSALSANQRSLVRQLASFDGVHESWDPPDLGPASPWMNELLVEHGRSYLREQALRAELARARGQLGSVINRTRLKVLAYRAFRRVFPSPHRSLRLDAHRG